MNRVVLIVAILCTALLTTPRADAAEKVVMGTIGVVNTRSATRMSPLWSSCTESRQTSAVGCAQFKVIS